EGQGPEHSSGRIERFLTLCAQDNLQVVQPTTAAQHFHVLRRQMHRDVRKPLIIFMPKSLLLAKEVQTPAAAFTSGCVEEVRREACPPVAAEDVHRVLRCSGKVAYDRRRRRNEQQAPAVVVRVKQLYPWPGEQIAEAIRAHPHARDVMWVQDEP